MKRIVCLLILLLYLVPAIGITVSAHYCGSRITWVSLNFEDQEHNCACGSKKMKTDCCKDKVAFIKLNNKQLNTIYNFYLITNTSTALIPLQSYSYKSVWLSKLNIFQDLYLPPPDNLKHPLYVCNCTFLI
jgi:hypothetical protein